MVNEKELIVLSLFDGMSCGQIALERAGIKVDRYYASELDKHAIKITQKNYPKTIQLGDITNWKEWNIPKPDLIIGGSPCQGFSRAGKQLNFEDPRSKLFFEFVNIKNHYDPQYFLLENVKMKKEYEDIITKYMKCHPIQINSNLVSAQNRSRLYWTNMGPQDKDLIGRTIPRMRLPKDKGIILKDILEENVDEKYFLKGKHLKFLDKDSYDLKKGRSKINAKKAIPLLAGSYDKWRGNYIQGEGFEVDNRFYFDDSKMGCLNTSTKGKVIIPPPIALTSARTEEGKKIRRENKGKETWKEKELTPRTDGKTNCLTTNESKENYIITHNLQPRMGKGEGGKGHLQKDDQRSYCLDTGNAQAIEIKKQPSSVTESRIRKLTPLECERLQTVSDNYTEDVSDNQRYKMLGNGWTIDVIVHIFKYINK